MVSGFMEHRSWEIGISFLGGDSDQFASIFGEREICWIRWSDFLVNFNGVTRNDGAIYRMVKLRKIHGNISHMEQYSSEIINFEFNKVRNSSICYLKKKTLKSCN